MAKKKVQQVYNLGHSKISNSASLKNFYELPIKKVADEKTWDLPIVDMGANVLTVLAVLNTNDHVWVVDDQKKKRVQGVITEHDMLGLMNPVKKIPFFGLDSGRSSTIDISEPVENIMQYHPVTCCPNDKVSDVLRKMTSHSCRRIAIIDKQSKELIGEITLHQIIRRYFGSIKKCLETNSIETCNA